MGGLCTMKLQIVSFRFRFVLFTKLKLQYVTFFRFCFHACMWIGAVKDFMQPRLLEES